MLYGFHLNKLFFGILMVLFFLINLLVTSRKRLRQIMLFLSQPGLTLAQASFNSRQHKSPLGSQTLSHQPHPNSHRVTIRQLFLLVRDKGDDILQG